MKNILYSGDPSHPQVSTATQGARHHVAQLPLIGDYRSASPRETFLRFLVNRVLLDIPREIAKLNEYPPQMFKLPRLLAYEAYENFSGEFILSICKNSIFSRNAPIAIYTLILCRCKAFAILYISTELSK